MTANVSSTSENIEDCTSEDRYKTDVHTLSELAVNNNTIETTTNTQEIDKMSLFDIRSSIPSLLQKIDCIQYGEDVPLHVRDAINYLEQIKSKFTEKPNIYHQFLHIMQEFRIKSIDIPDVVERVATLFRGHNALICGFDTFLPKGYRVECSIDDVVKLVTPMGTMTIVTGDSNTCSELSVDLNCAVKFVDKIKRRFDTATYKSFLSILQTYQKEQNYDLYAQVESLFRGAEDILGEFRLFLPDDDSFSLKRKATAQEYKNKRSRVSPVDISAMELVFFDRVREYIGNQQTYSHFLRILNLFTQQVLDAYTLLEQCESYLGGNKELYGHLKLLLGYSGKDPVIGHISDISKQTNMIPPDCGPSYRSVPISWKNQSCSGRDALCWEVLNDEYVSHPTWASEDSGFIASKKNQFEEALHRVEEERYDYDSIIDATSNTLALLDPIAKRLKSMTETQKKAFKLTPGLGGESISIYERVIKQVYGDEEGENIIDMLYNKPATTVPMVIRKLHQQNEEWRAAQSDWNKVWREVEVKNYYKALDYQSGTFKANDRKMTTIRYLVNEIDALRMDQIAESNYFSPQMTFLIKDYDVLRDVTRILFSYFTVQTAYSPEDCIQMNEFIETFVPLFFDMNDGSDTSSFTSNDESEGVKDTITIFGNINLYCFFRLFLLCYERLSQMKQIEIDYKTNGGKSKLMNRSALELNITTATYNSIKTVFKEGYYDTLLSLIVRFFRYEIDQPTFEECVRYLFGSKAFLMFTIDKLMIALVRQIHQIITNTQTQELVAAFNKHNEWEKKTLELFQAYRLEVTEKLGEHDNLYNITFDTSNHELSMQLLEKNDEMFDTHDLDRYTEYMAEYTSWDTDTPSIDRKKMNRTFLRRNLNYCRNEHDIDIRSNLQYKICRNTYHLFYVVHTEDSFIKYKRKRTKMRNTNKSKLS